MLIHLLDKLIATVGVVLIIAIVLNFFGRKGR